ATNATPVTAHRRERLAGSRAWAATSIAPAMTATWAMRDPLSHTPPARITLMPPQIVRACLVARCCAIAKAMHAPMAKYDPTALTSRTGPLTRAARNVVRLDD